MEEGDETISPFGAWAKIPARYIGHPVTERGSTKVRRSAPAKISTAPDLLDAVKNMMHDIEIFYAHHREPGNKYLINLKAAIAKMEGRE